MNLQDRFPGYSWWDDTTFANSLQKAELISCYGKGINILAQLGQSPKPAEHGSFLHKTSVGGNRVDFLKTAVASSYATLTVAAGSSSNFGINVALYDPELPSATRTSENLLTFDQAIVWYYTDFFVDTDDNFNYELTVGPSLSSGQQKIVFHSWDEKTPLTGTTHRRLYQFFNNDSSDHTIYAHVAIKYILNIAI